MAASAVFLSSLASPSSAFGSSFSACTVGGEVRETVRLAGLGGSVRGGSTEDFRLGTGISRVFGARISPSGRGCGQGGAGVAARSRRARTLVALTSASFLVSSAAAIFPFLPVVAPRTAPITSRVSRVPTPHGRAWPLALAWRLVRVDPGCGGSCAGAFGPRARVPFGAGTRVGRGRGGRARGTCAPRVGSLPRKPWIEVFRARGRKEYG